MELMFSWHMLEDRQRRIAFVQCVVALSVETLFGFMPFTDISAQIGGIIVGYKIVISSMQRVIIFSLLFGIYRFSKEAAYESIKRWLPTFALIGLILYFSFGFVLFFIVVVPVKG